jgi:hypothetical protein
MIRIILLSILSLFCFQANAQKGLHVGGKFLPQSTWMFNNDDSDNGAWKYVPTYRSAFGASISYHFMDGIGVGTDLLISRQGQRFSVDTGTKIFARMDYMKIPLLLHLNSSTKSTTHFYFNIGPQIAMLRSAEWDVQHFTNTTLPMTDNYLRMNIGATLALGAGFKITHFLNAHLGIRLDGSWQDVEDKSRPFWPANRAKTWHTTGAIDVGVSFIIHGKRDKLEGQ